MDWTVAEHVHGITIILRVEDNKEVLPGEDEIIVLKDLRQVSFDLICHPNETAVHKGKSFELYTPVVHSLFWPRASSRLLKLFEGQNKGDYNI